MNDTRIARYCDLFLCLSLSLFASRPLKAAIRLNSKTVMAAATAFDGKVGIVRRARMAVSAGKVVGRRSGFEHCC